jgi:hypothetical protein
MTKTEILRRRDEVPTYTIPQAIGIALSILMSKTTMGECQQVAPKFIRHLRALGWKLARAKP